MSLGTLPTGLEPGGRFADWRATPVSYVVCDVDGTLIGPQDLSSVEVVAATQRAQAAGMRVGYATGRMRAAVRALHSQLEARGPHVLHNGAEVRADGRTIAAWPLTAAHVDGLLSIAAGHDDGYVEIYTEDGYVASRHDPRARAHWRVLGSEPQATIATAGELGGATVLKATFALFDPSAVPEIIAAVERLGLVAGPATSPRTPDLRYVNATHPDADKGRALRRAASELDLPMDEVAAIGDGANDLSMLAVAGTAIAMGQAPAEVRAAAHVVVPEVDAHGVAVALDALRAGARIT